MIKVWAKEFMARLLCMTGAAALARRSHRGQLAILMFHGVEPKPLSPPCWHVIDVDTLRRQLEYLQRHFTVLPLEEALERLHGGTLPDRAAVVTFDDGTQNLITRAAPVLRDVDVPASVFLATGPMGTEEALWPDQLWLAFARTQVAEVDLTALGLGSRQLRNADDRGEAYQLTVHHLKGLPDDQRLAWLGSVLTALAQDSNSAPGPFRLLSWEEARALAEGSDVTLYPHTVTHPILARCPDPKLEHEIAASCTTVARETGRAPTVFAYPNGRAQDFDERCKNTLRDLEVPWALSTIWGFADRGSDPLALPRIGIGSDLSFARFCLLVSGVRPRRRAAQTRTEGDRIKPAP